MASRLTRGRSESGSSEWMSSLKSTFSSLKTSATAALDNLESKLGEGDLPPRQQQQQQTAQPSTPIDPAEVENVHWAVPRYEGSKEKEYLLQLEVSNSKITFVKKTVSQ